MVPLIVALVVVLFVVVAVIRAVRIIPQLVGQALPMGATEYYVHVPDPGPSTLHALLKAAGVSDRLRLITDCLAALAGMPVIQIRERLRVGMSYRIVDGEQVVVSVFIHAAQISERNGEIRQRLIALARQLSLDLSLYERLTLPLTEREAPLPLHGLVGLTVAPSGKLSLSVGVRPPAE